MTSTDTMAASASPAAMAVPPTTTGVLAVRVFAWAMLTLLVAFLINNLIVIQFDLPNAGFGGTTEILLLLPYVVALVAAFVFSSRTRETRSLRQDSAGITAFNTWFIRGAFFGVLFVGIADAAISWIRVEQMLGAWVGEEMERNLARSTWRGWYVHLPLLVLGYVVGSFVRTLGFIWLALLIVLAELLIVISRYVFSYEQAFMGDLVRFWYAALFLFASAYTLFEDGHVRVDVLYAGFGQTTKGKVNAFGCILLGISLCWVILYFGMGSKTSIINAPIANFEITQSGVGMYVKYMMAGFLGVFAVSMMIQFCAYLLESVADWRGDPGHRDGAGASAQ